MNSFQEIKLNWKGRDAKIAPDNVLDVVAMIEDVITLPELFRFAERGTTAFAKIARAYGIILRYAGIEVTDAEVYFEFFRRDTDDGVKARERAAGAVQTLLMMMVPPGTFKAAEAEDAGKSNDPTATSDSKQ